MPFDAFISYSHKDKLIADAACATVEGAGVRCWIAPRDIRPGAEWGESIAKGIDQCPVLILILSSSSNDSRQVQREVGRAFNKGLTIVPVRIEDVEPVDALAFDIGTFHWLDALTEPRERYFRDLARHIQAIIATRPKRAAATPDSQESSPAMSATAVLEHDNEETTVGSASPADDAGIAEAEHAQQRIRNEPTNSNLNAKTAESELSRSYSDTSNLKLRQIRFPSFKLFGAYFIMHGLTWLSFYTLYWQIGGKIYWFTQPGQLMFVDMNPFIYSCIICGAGIIIGIIFLSTDRIELTYLGSIYSLASLAISISCLIVINDGVSWYINFNNGLSFSQPGSYVSSISIEDESMMLIMSSAILAVITLLLLSTLLRRVDPLSWIAHRGRSLLWLPTVAVLVALPAAALLLPDHSGWHDAAVTTPDRTFTRLAAVVLFVVGVLLTIFPVRHSIRQMSAMPT
jgi:hypothetical protein